MFFGHPGIIGDATGNFIRYWTIAGENVLTTSTQFLELEELPHRIVFAGGGYIAFEFAHIAARAGAQVQVLHRGSRPLEKFDPDLVSMLVQASRELGIEVHVNRAVTAIERQGDHLLVRARTGTQEHTVEADLVVHAAGRMPEIDDLELEAAGVAREKGGVSVNKYLHSVTNPAVYAAGPALYDAPRGHDELVFLAAGGPLAHRLEGARRGGNRAYPGGASVGLACRGGHQPLRSCHRRGPAGKRSQAHGLRLPHKRVGCELHALIAAWQPLR